MKKVMIIIRPEKYRQTKEALEKEGFSAFSVMNVQGRGKRSVEFSAGDGSNSDGTERYHRFVTKKLLIVYINDEDERRLSETVIGVNKMGQAGDGKIFVSPIKRSIRIRTGEENEDALV